MTYNDLCLLRTIEDHGYHALQVMGFVDVTPQQIFNTAEKVKHLIENGPTDDMASLNSSLILWNHSCNLRCASCNVPYELLVNQDSFISPDFVKQYVSYFGPM